MKRTSDWTPNTCNEDFRNTSSLDPGQMGRFRNDVCLIHSDKFRISSLHTTTDRRVLLVYQTVLNICDSMMWPTPPASPRTSSPTFQDVTSEPSWVMIPENSTPKIVDAPGGLGYLPSRWEMSILLSPNALIWSYKGVAVVWALISSMAIPTRYLD